MYQRSEGYGAITPPPFILGIDTERSPRELQQAYPDGHPVFTRSMWQECDTEEDYWGWVYDCIQSTVNYP